MPKSKILMTELVSMSPQFLRSVHLERDFYAKDTDGYLVTRGSLSALSMLARGSTNPSYRAQSISGPYGVGKSALAMYFSRLLDKDMASMNGFRERARTCLAEVGERLIPADRQGYFTVLATGVRESLSSCLMRSLERSLQKSGKRNIQRRLFKRNLPTEGYSPRQVVEMFEDLARLAVQEGALGTVVIIDELGKLLEYAALHPEDDDIHLLQEMAEAASRSHEYPLWFITILHQDFSYYASHLGRSQQSEWFKVQQRFFDVPCMLDEGDTFQLVAAALSSSENPLISENKQILEAAKQCAKLAPRVPARDFITCCLSSYPLHPSSLVLLPPLFRRFGQNERSLFSFLSADEPFSLRDWVQKRPFQHDNPPFLRLPQLYDYTFHTLIGTKSNVYSARVWAEAEDALTRLSDAPPLEIDLLKSIGLLGLVGDASPISASRELLHTALASPTCSIEQIDSSLKSLESKKLVVFRRYRNAYRLWEGSDIDVTERLREAYQALALNSISLAVARDLCPSPPLVVRRHSFRTGMLRFLSVVPSGREELLTNTQLKNDCDGHIIQCLVQSEEEAKTISSYAQQVEDPSVIIEIGKENDELNGSARDVAALEWVNKNTPSLAGDRVARQELSERRLEAENIFRTEWEKIFEPGQKAFRCYWRGKEYSGLSNRKFASLLSDACDETFPSAPVVKNELINRRVLSSSASAARRNLIEAMILNPELPGLGITGYPPQRSIYESLLLQSGMHRKAFDGKWIFARPLDSDPGLQKAWDYIVQTAQSDDLKPKSIAELFRELSASPYGVANGFVPVLLCACLLVNSSGMALYEDGAFVPELTVQVMERLMHRPECFSLVSFGLSGERSEVTERFARGFHVDKGTLPIVRSIYARIKSLPQYTLTTKNLSPGAIAVREAILKAKSPERLLFAELPQALGIEPFQSNTENPSNADKLNRFFASLNTVFTEFVKCYPNLLERVRKGILTMFDISDDDKEWVAKISKIALRLSNAAIDSKLRVVMMRAKDGELGETEYLESIAAGMVGQPPNRWSRIDEDNFSRFIPELGTQMRIAESVQELRSVLEENEDGFLFTISDKDGKTVRRLVRFSKEEDDEVRNIAARLTGKEMSNRDKRIWLAALVEASRKLASPSPAEFSLFGGQQTNE